MIVNTYGSNPNAKRIDFNVLLGKTLTEIQGAEAESEEIIFTCSDGTKYVMYHEQDCCECVTVNDICGDVNCLIGCQIYMAEESASSEGGESNGYYSESVDFVELINPSSQN